MNVEQDPVAARVRLLLVDLDHGRLSAELAGELAGRLASSCAWLTIAEASRRLGVAPEALRARANRSATTIVSKWIGKRRVVSWPSVVAELRQQPLRPRITRKQHASTAVAGHEAEKAVEGTS